MRVNRATFLAVCMLTTWGGLFLFNVQALLFPGASTIFLPISLIAFLAQQLRMNRPSFDLSILFLSSCLFFFCISVILWPLSSVPPTEFYSLVITTFSLPALDKVSLLIGVSIAITMLTLGLCGEKMSKFTPPTFIPDIDARAPSLHRIGMRLMILAIPAVGYESWQQFRYIQEVGYLALYTEGVPTSAWAGTFFYMFFFGFGIAFTFADTRRKLLVPAMLYLVVATLDSLKGARGAVIVPILFIVWYYTSRFDVRVRIIAVTRNLALLIGLFFLLTYLRDPALFDKGIGQFLIDALSSQGRSLQLTTLYVDVADKVGQFGNNMVLSNLLIPIIAIVHPEVREAAQSMDQVLYSNNLKHILTYVLNETYYFAGGGTGGVYIIELIESGPIGYLLLSMGLGWFLAWLPKAMSRAWVRYLSIYFFATIFYLPRGEFFFNTLIVGKALFLYFCVATLYGISRRMAPKKALPLDPAQTVAWGQP